MRLVREASVGMTGHRGWFWGSYACETLAGVFCFRARYAMTNLGPDPFKELWQLAKQAGSVFF